MIEAARAVLEPLWPALAAAFALGLPFGAAGWRSEPPGFWGRVGLILLAVGALGVAAAIGSGRVPGRAGLWLELGAAVLVAYVAGCAGGSLGRSAFLRISGRGERQA